MARGNIRSRSKGSWELTFDVGKHADGKRRQESVTVRGTKRDAERELARILREIDTGSFVAMSRMTVREFLERWLRDYAKSNVAAKTYERYEEIVRLHLNPAIGQVQLAKLQPLMIQRMYTDALENGRLDQPGGLSQQTVLHHHRLLHRALQLAVKWQLLARNPCDAVEPPSPTKPEMRALTPEQSVLLLRAAHGTPLYIPIVLAFATGMRRGEICGLKWEDVDLKQGEVTVRRSLEETRAGLAFKVPKTKKSQRTVSLPSFAVDILVRHRADQERTRSLMGNTYQELGLVVCNPDGSPLRPDYITHAFPKLVRRIGLPPVRFHDLRHSHVAHLIQDKVHVKTISERMGHSSSSFTMDQYGHLLPGAQEEAAQGIHNKLGGAFESEP